MVGTAIIGNDAVKDGGVDIGIKLKQKLFHKGVGRWGRALGLQGTPGTARGKPSACFILAHPLTNLSLRYEYRP
jgi:hypothetical protein